MPDKTVIVTGASRGLGEAIVRQLMTQDCSVVMFARDDTRLQRLANTLWRAIAIAGDITNQNDCERLIDETLTRFDKIDAVINCAGIIEPIETLENADADAWAKVYDVNVLGALRVTQLALPHLFKQGGRIINVSSNVVNKLKPGFGAYSTSKVALNHLTQMTALENEQVICLAVGPGVVDTDMQKVIKRDTQNRDDIIGQFFNRRSERDRTLPAADNPAKAIATLALHADFNLQGQYILWDDEPVQQLVTRFWS
jgi:NAD(P)-dependent dehydrogenase (short-subunit alcohol dehydrogenase family)